MHPFVETDHFSDAIILVMQQDKHSSNKLWILNN